MPESRRKCGYLRSAHIHEYPCIFFNHGKVFYTRSIGRERVQSVRRLVRYVTYGIRLTGILWGTCRVRASSESTSFLPDNNSWTGDNCLGRRDSLRCASSSPRHFGVGYRQVLLDWHTVDVLPSSVVPSWHRKIMLAPRPVLCSDFSIQPLYSGSGSPQSISVYTKPQRDAAIQSHSIRLN